MRFYGNLTRRCAVFNVCCIHRYQSLQILQYLWFFSPLLTLGFLNIPRQRESIFLALLAVTHEVIEALLVWW